MKFFVAFTALVAVASALPTLPSPATIAEHLQAIAAAIPKPEITAEQLANLLEQILAARPDPVEIGPAFIEEPIPVPPSPVVIGEIAPGSPPPLVQIIVNVNSPDDYSFPRPEPIFEEPDSVVVVEDSPVPIEPVHVVNPVIPDPAVNLPIDLN